LPRIERPDRGRPKRIADIRPGAADSHPYGLTALGRSVIFQAFRDDVGTELWRSDGTEAGTVLVRDIRPGKASSNPYGFTRFKDAVMFQADGGNGTELWISDGTSDGTRLVRELASGEWGSYPEGFAVLRDVVLFAAWDSLHGVELWRTDGTADGTFLLRDLNPNGDGAPQELIVPRLVDFRAGRLAYFTADDGVSGRQLWVSDGTADGTRMITSSFNAGNGAPRVLTVMQGEVFLRGSMFNSRIVLWRANPNGVEPVNFAIDRRREPGCFYPEEIVALGDRLIFSCRDYPHGKELWTSDGSAAGTQLVKDISTSGDGNPRQLTVVGNQVYFYANDGHSGWELWRSDGTSGGTVMVRDIDPTNTTVPSFLTALGDTLFFTANTPSFGRELWRSDGTPAGTVMVRNIHLTRSAYPEDLVDVAGALFFYADDGLAGEELWAFAPCGDGKLQPSEACDDGNRADGDGCSASCDLEDPRARCSEARACVGGRHLSVDGGVDLRVRLAAVDPTLDVGSHGTDPRIGGMTVEVGNPFTGERATFALPADGWTAARGGGRVRFRGAKDAPCRKAVFGGGRLRLACRGGGDDLTLDEPAQGRLDVRVTTGNLRRWCLTFGGEITTDRASAGRQHGRFDARHAPPPSFCL
jgi:ELWxxDGT repeat protein/cysteine-rich repeat protein